MSEQIAFGSRAAFDSAADHDIAFDNALASNIAATNVKAVHGKEKELKELGNAIGRQMNQDNSRRVYINDKGAIDDDGYVINESAYKTANDMSDRAAKNMQSIREKVDALDLDNEQELLGQIDEALDNEHKIKQGLQKHTIVTEEPAPKTNDSSMGSHKRTSTMYSQPVYHMAVSDSRLKNIIKAASRGSELGLNI